jgi:hypothetical protein
VSTVVAKAFYNNNSPSVALFPEDTNKEPDIYLGRIDTKQRETVTVFLIIFIPIRRESEELK